MSLGVAQRGRVSWRALLAVLLLVFVAAAGWFWLSFTRFAVTPLRVNATGESVDIGRGTSFKDIVHQLRSQGLTTSAPLYWRVLAEKMRVAGRLHAGEYALTPGITPTDLLNAMAQGRVMQRDVTIVDGWTFRDVLQALAKADRLKHETAVLDDAAIMRRIGAPDEKPEGRFLPETYAYVKGDSDLDVLRRAHEAMSKTLAALWAQRDPSVPFATPYDALILASIVEKETGRADERPRVAGVFIRRLQKNMLLQADPTVIYGMGSSYAGSIHKSDLITDTPYNTYTRTGLPPTPIAMPGKPAIEAVLHPAAGNELYFVARGNGTHIFASTLEEQNRNVACYQLKRCQ
ncbi:endolytic transglycosylase MltG [Dyella flagellata]|uniref:Endolytic murein transglycosylase n=1 Tax=Dyella flagellata TaxID=1867833 RepID=A0ABQ5X8J2_9GAMM|nr:endolytic transglycosylase MltG [Dyella flagellata]GLQ87006.1 aminodeoxychorismate lyase [Dyella flagellata]